MTAVKDRVMIEADPRSGAWNMAFDEALLEAAVGRGQTALRIYRWDEATLSLGHFQKVVPADLSEPLRTLPRVRRLSGGGAILHDREWTYSCAVPKGHRLAARSEHLYDAIHAALVQAFGRMGIPVISRGEGNRAADDEFLCFLRGDERDLLVGRNKVVGSAQRRRRGAVLQHGSVLLGRSPLTPEVPGIRDLWPAAGDDPLLGAAAFVAEVTPELFGPEVGTRAAEEDIAFAKSRVARYRLADAAEEAAMP